MRHNEACKINCLTTYIKLMQLPYERKRLCRTLSLNKPSLLSALRGHLSREWCGLSSISYRLPLLIACRKYWSVCRNLSTHARRNQISAILHRVGDKVNPSEFTHQLLPAVPVRGEIFFFFDARQSSDLILDSCNISYISIGCSSKLTLYDLWRGRIYGLRVAQQDKVVPCCLT